ncbi:TPA: DUF167 domain-containing protein [Legionella bozemanae]
MQSSNRCCWRRVEDKNRSEDKANVELVRYLAVLFKVPKSQIKIQRSLKSRHKIIEVLGCGVDVQWLIDL